MKKLLRKNPIKSKKQQLCNKINQCKSLKELKQWEKVFSYYDVLKDDFDWDYEFLLDLIEFKLKRMRDYFWTHNIIVNEKQYGDMCNNLIKILYTGYKSDIVLTSDLKSYVNVKNSQRFLPKYMLEHYKKQDYIWEKYGLATLREEKAKKLFWNYLYNKIELLWE